MFVNASMSEMLNVGGSRGAEGMEESPGLPKPEEDHHQGVAHSPLMEDIISSSPASPASTNGEVPNPVSPMPLLPQFLFNGRNNSHQNASTPPREPSGGGATSSGCPPSILPRVQKRLELSPLNNPHPHPYHHQGHGGHPPPTTKVHPLSLQGAGVHTVGGPRMRTDPGAPPGCTEHSLNILGGHYLLLDHLEGSHLQRCIDVNTKQEYVCKTVRNDPSGQAMLIAHNRVDGHPHINPLQEVIVGDKLSYLFFPPCSTDLHSYVRTRRRLREPHARILFRQIVSAVNEAHCKGLVLRDLKLRKFVFTDDTRSTLRLESLEDAVVLESEDDLLSDKHGCPAYVSPEILRTNSQYSGRAADMWGLGVMLYTMLVGRYPFHGQEHTGLFAKIRRGQFTLPESISSRAKCLIRCLLRKDPTQRLTTEDVLIHPWVTLATPTSACHASSSRDSRRVQPSPQSSSSGSGSSGSTGSTGSSVQTTGGGSNGSGVVGSSSSLGLGPPSLLATPLGASTPSQLMSSSTSTNLLGHGHHGMPGHHHGHHHGGHHGHHHHHASVDHNNLDQIVPEFFPPHDEMDFSPFKY